MPVDAEPTRDHGPAESEQTQPRGAVLSQALERYWASLDAIRHLDEHLAPRAAQLDNDRFSPSALTAVASLPPERQARLKAWWESKTNVQEIGSEATGEVDGTEESAPGAANDASVQPEDVPTPQAASIPRESSGASSAALVPANGEAGTDLSRVASDDVPERDEHTEERDDVRELQDILGNRAVAVEFALHLKRSVTAPMRASLLRGSLLVTAFGAFEVLVGAIVREFYLAHPGALGDEPKFSLKDLQDLETLDDARDYAIGGRVESLLQESFVSWERWFAKYLKARPRGALYRSIRVGREFSTAPHRGP